LHFIAGAEARQMEIKANVNKSRLDSLLHPKGRFGSFEFKQGPRLPSMSSFFKGPIETSTLSTQLARKGARLQIAEAGTKGHVIGSIDSIGEYIRPNADPSFLFSITPFTKSEVQRGKKSKDVLFGKLEKTWRKQESAEEKTRSNRSTSGTTGTCARINNLRRGRGRSSSASQSSQSSQRESALTASSSKTDRSSIVSEEAGPASSYNRAPPPSRAGSSVDTVNKDETLTGDRHRFDALVNRLQKKLSESSERSEQPERADRDRKVTTPNVGKTPNNTDNTSTHDETRSEAGRRGRLVVHGSHPDDGTMSSRANSLTAVQRERMLASTTGFPVSQNREIMPSTKMDEPNSSLKATNATNATNLSIVETKDGSGPPLEDSNNPKSTPVVKQDTEYTEHQPPPLPPRPKIEPNPCPPSSVINGGGRKSALNHNQPPFHPSQASFPQPSFPGQQTTMPAMVPQAGVWQSYPQQVPAQGPFPPVITAPIPLPAAAPPLPGPGGTMLQWPMSKRPNNRRRTPFVPISAADQQKIEEHIELLKSTIPNYATLSKRRQELRWGKQKGKANHQQAGGSCPWTHSSQPQWPHLQPFVPQQQVPLIHSVQPAQKLNQLQLHALHMQQIQQLQQMQQVQQMQQMQQVQQDQQYYQQGQPALPTQPVQHMQRRHQYAQYFPSALGTATWTPVVNSKM
jgi:hypothetical protein